MKIGIDCRFWGLENAGLGRYTEELVRHIEKLDDKNQYTLFLKEKYFNQLNFKRNFTKVAAEFKHYGFSEQTQLLRLLNKLNLDLVHFLHFNIPVLYKGNFIVTIHDLLMQKHRGATATTLPFYKYYPKQIVAKYVFKQAVVKAKRIIVPSFSVKKEVEDYFHIKSNKILITYEGVRNLAEKNSGLKVLEKYKIIGTYFIYTGNAYPHKNLHRLIEAVVELKKQLVIVSSRNVFTKKLEDYIKKMNAEKYVKLLGFVPDSDLWTLYKNSIAFVFPSLSEGFGLPGFESIVAGSVLAASDIPVFKEIYKSNCFYFDPFKTSSIVATLRQVDALNLQERLKIISEAQEYATKFTWEKTAKETLEVYKSVV